MQLGAWFSLNTMDLDTSDRCLVCNLEHHLPPRVPRKRASALVGGRVGCLLQRHWTVVALLDLSVTLLLWWWSHQGSNEHVMRVYTHIGLTAIACSLLLHKAALRASTALQACTAVTVLPAWNSMPHATVCTCTCCV